MNSSTTTRVIADSASGRCIQATQASMIAAFGVALLFGLPGRVHAFSCSTPSFATHQDFAVTANPGSVAAGDFNHDGKLDLVSANGNAGSVSVLLNDGLGGFGAASDITVGTSPIFVAVGDFNNDLNLDLAVVDFAGKVWVLLGNGLGGFGAPTGYPVGTQPVMLVVGSFNPLSDTKADLAVVDYTNGGEVSLLLNNGDGTFGAATTFTAGAFPLGIALGDFDNNGRQDLAVANLSANTVSVLSSNGDGTFAAPVGFPVGGGPAFVAVGDIDGDSNQDLAVANLGAGTVSVLLGNGSGGFGAPTNYTLGTQPASIAVGDFNGDNKLDIVVANGNSNTVSVLLNNGGGLFAPAVNIPVNHSPGSVTVADVDGDGKMDIVMSDVDTNAVSVLRNACGNPVHDTVVLPVNPVSVTIPLGQPSVTKKISVRVRNADTTHTTGYNVKLEVDDSDCGIPGTVAGTPDFLPAAPGVTDIIQVADGKTKTAKVALTISSSAFTSFNHNAPHRCTLWFTSSAQVAQLNGDPTPSNNTFPVELSITDKNDPDQTALHETTIASLKPVTLTIASGKPSKTLTARPKVGNADVELSGDVISAAAVDGTCPSGTVGAVDLAALTGIQPSATVAGGAKKGGTLAVTAFTSVCTPNTLAPRRCIATVSASGPGGDTDSTNNTTRLVIDMVDKNDLPGSCTP